MTMRLVACLECGRNFEMKASRPREFCRAVCRKRWNNRRMTRGAEMFDLYMAHRFDRKTAVKLGVFQAINRLASDYRSEDRGRRDGRRSWREPITVLQERPHLKGISTMVRAGR